MMRPMTSARERIGWLDVAITVFFSALGVLLMAGNVDDPKVNAPVAAIPVFLLVTVPLLWRRADPVRAMGASLAGLLFHDVLFGTAPIRCGVVLPTVLILAFSAGARLELRQARIALLLGLGSILAESITFFGPFGIVMSGVLSAVWYSGRIARSRTKLAGELKQRTVELREARDRRAHLEVVADRARVAGQLDELLQRRLGELARLADAGAAAHDPAGATATLAEIERESRRTLDEMRGVVGVLRADDSGVPTEPQPTLTHLEAMLVRAKGTGASLRVEGNPRVLPAGVELSAYRIVEHLLGALDDSPDVEVRVHFADDALEIEVSGPARRRAQAAIERARERVELHRGTLEATFRSGRADAVVELPMLVEA
jgi:hypothetical protein